MTAKSPHTIDFGAIDEFGAHVFRAEIPMTRGDPVRIIEDFGYDGGERGKPHEELRAVLDRRVWTAIADAARIDFNDRLKAKRQPAGRWKTPITKLDRLLGRELCVLAWASEEAHEDLLPVVCSRWAALRPEERWWLFAMTVAEAGTPEDFERGWRRALRAALQDGARMTREDRRRNARRASRADEPNLTLPFGR